MSANQVEIHEIDLFDIWRILRKNAKTIAIIFLAAVSISGIVTYFFIPKKYESSITFYVQQKTSTSRLSSLVSQFGAIGGLLGDVGGLAATAELCSEIVTSRRLIETVLSEHNLPHSPEDIRGFAGCVTVEDRKSGAIRISVLWTDPEMACRLTETIFEHYRRFMEESIQSTSSSQRRFLEEQYEKSKARLARAEEDLLQYQKQKGLLLLPEQATKAIGYFADLEKQRIEAEVALTEAERRLREADALLAEEAPLVKAAITETLNPILQGYRTSLTQIEIDLAKAREIYTDEHPAVKDLIAQRDGLMARMQQEKERILTSETLTANPVYQELAAGYLQSRIEAAGLETRRKALNSVYDKYNDQLARLPDELREYGTRIREQKVAEQIYLLLSSQLEEAKIKEAKEENVVIQVIDPACVPDKKHSPSTKLNMAIAGFLAVFTGIGLAFLREFVEANRDRAASST